MPHELINHNPDLKKLKDEGYAVEARDGFLLLHEIPYVNSKGQIKYGILVSDLSSIAGDQTVSPIGQHVAYFIGEHPCNADGSLIKGIQHNSQTQELAKGIVINHSFSNKPAGGYKNYHQKMSTYANIISSQAKAVDDSVTEKPFTDIQGNEQETIFKYADTNSSKAKITSISSKIENQKIAIVGLGGTGSYILDLIAKTHVKEIHLYDGDMLLQNNAFKSPSAISKDELQSLYKKTDYYQQLYSKMRNNIYSHPYHITLSNVEELSIMDFVFIAIDKGNAKIPIVDHLSAQNKPFIDVGMGILMIDDCLLGHIRVTTCTREKRDHIKERITFSEEGAANDYDTNIQIADLNALNAALAVMKWKKIFGIYQDLDNEFNTTYSINDGKLFNEDYIT
jgi:hypothetical protein